jgi:sialate O-acetylesterase
MTRQLKLAGGKVKGVLWYQGESDANDRAAEVYPKVFADFIGSVRSDLGQPDLPFYFVQIGRFVHAGDPKPWNAVQDAERTLPDRVPNTAVVASIDLELDDLIHVGTQGQKRLGQRLAKVALRELFGQVGATTPTLDRVIKGPNNTLVVRFKGVNIGPEPAAGAATAFGAGFRQLPVRPQGTAASAGGTVVGLHPQRHIAGFSVRKEDGTEIPLIFDAAVGNARDTVVLKLIGPIPEKAFLWYGHGYDPNCNLSDAQDMAVPVFGPVPLDDVR